MTDLRTFSRLAGIAEESANRFTGDSTTDYTGPANTGTGEQRPGQCGEAAT